MYDTEYGTDWSVLSAEQAIERAYALGVAETLGEEHPDELERLVEAAGSPHDRSLVRLAYDKGRSRGMKAAASEEDDREVWTGLVNDVERERIAVSRPRTLPPALRSVALLDPPGDGLDRVRLPRFLLRR